MSEAGPSISLEVSMEEVKEMAQSGVQCSLFGYRPTSRSLKDIPP